MRRSSTLAHSEEDIKPLFRGYFPEAPGPSYRPWPFPACELGMPAPDLPGGGFLHPAPT